MATEQETKNNTSLHKEFQNLLDQDFKDRKLKENEIITATVTEIMKNFIEPDWVEKIQDEIDNNNIFIISMKNNHKLLNFKNYSKPIEIKGFNEYKNIDNNTIYIYHPQKCY